MTITNELIVQKAQEIYDYVRKTKGYLHENPEVTGEEFETSKFLQAEVEKLGLPIEMASTTGFIATLDTGKPGKTIGIRADIDALPMSESPDNLKGPKAEVSKVEGVAHTCGHDAHMAMALGAAKVLTEMKDQLTGKIIFIFEEGEERGTGIEGMIQTLKKQEKIDAIYGIHVTSFTEAGTINIDAGPRMAGSTVVDFEVIGRGGHGSRPDLSINPVFAAANILTGIGTAWPNRLNVEETVTLGIATINGGTAPNIIPDSVRITGTLRYFNKEEAQNAVDVIKNVATYTAKAHSCEVKFAENAFGIADAVINDEKLSAEWTAALKEVLPEEKIVTGNKWYGSESFRRYAEVAPSILAHVGAGKPEEGFGAEHHNVHFDVHDDALRTGVLSIIKIVADFLKA